MLRATERRVLIGFGFALAVLAVVATASIASIRTLQADSESLQRSRQAIGRLELALSSTLEVGTALRGYLLTREDSILAPLAHVNQTVDSLLALLREPDERDVVQVDSIGLLVHERVAVADSIILLQRTHGDSAARAEWSHGRGVQLQAMIARLVRTLQETERTRADARGSAADRNARRATTVIATSAGLGLALTMAAVVLLHGGFRRARESEAALRASNALLDSRVQERTAQLERAVTDLEASEERLRTAVSSIPQQVWVCESDGSCSFASARWLEYSGASMDALVGNGWLAQV
ncbi:MAG: CHASE3 domain-containing protein, partial [Gemmatimonadaceae bacterium]